MDLKELLTEIGEEKAKIVNDAIAAAALVEKNKGIEASKKKGAENTKLIDKVAKTKDIVRDETGVDLGDFSDEQIEAFRQKLTELKTKKTDGGGSGDGVLEARLKKQEKLVADLQNQITEEKATAKTAQAKFQNAKITNKLTEATKDRFKGNDVLIENWILKGKVKLDDNENVVFVGESEGETIDQKAYLEQFAKDRADLVISNQIPGGGSAGGGNKDVSKLKQLTLSDFNNLDSVQKAQFMASGGKVN